MVLSSLDLAAVRLPSPLLFKVFARGDIPSHKRFSKPSSARLATTPQYLGSGLVTSLGPGGELLSSVSGKTCEVAAKSPMPSSCTIF